MRHVILVSTLLSLISCSFKSSSSQQVDYQQINTWKKSAIVRGDLMNKADSVRNGLVAIFDTLNDTTCSGILVGENIVLTAAHCLQSGDTYIKVVFGLQIDADDSSEDVQLPANKTRDVIESYAHPLYDDSTPANKPDQGDIALVKFAGTLPFGYQPVELLDDSSLVKKGTAVILAGYGVSEIELIPVADSELETIKEALAEGRARCDDEQKLKNCQWIEYKGQNTLRQTTVDVVAVSKSEFIVDSSKGSGSCFGDSGGPAFVQIDNQYYLAGVASRATVLCNKYAYYTNALVYEDWINAYLHSHR